MMVLTRTFKTINKTVAVKPFEPTVSAERIMKGGLVTTTQKNTLTPLEVVFINEDGRFKVGDVVYVKTELCKDPVSTAVYEVEDKKFILIRETDVQLLDFNPTYTINITNASTSSSTGIGVGSSGITVTGGDSGKEF